MKDENEYFSNLPEDLQELILSELPLEAILNTLKVPNKSLAKIKTNPLFWKTLYERFFPFSTRSCAIPENLYALTREFQRAYANKAFYLRLGSEYKDQKYLCREAKEYSDKETQKTETTLCIDIFSAAYFGNETQLLSSAKRVCDLINQSGPEPISVTTLLRTLGSTMTDLSLTEVLLFKEQTDILSDLYEQSEKTFLDKIYFFQDSRLITQEEIRCNDAPGNFKFEKIYIPYYLAHRDRNYELIKFIHTLPTIEIEKVINESLRFCIKVEDENTFDELLITIAGLSPKATIDTEVVFDAAKKAHLGFFKKLVDQDLFDPNKHSLAKRDRHCQPALEHAARTGNLDAIQALEIMGVNVDREPTIFHIAALEGHKNIVEYLLDKPDGGKYLTKQSQSNSISRWINTPTCTPIEAAAWGGHTDIVSLLLDKGAEAFSGESLSAAVTSNKKDVVELLLRRVAFSADVLKDSIDQISQEKEIHFDILEILLRKLAETQKASALAVAIIANDLTEIRALIPTSDINTRVTDSYSLLDFAVKRGNPEVVQLLLDKGAESAGALRHACALTQESRLDIIEKLLKKNHEKFINANEGKPSAPLHIALQNEAPLQVIKALIEAGADVNKPGPELDSPPSGVLFPLHLALKYPNSLDVIQLLLDKGADPNQIITPPLLHSCDLKNVTPLHLAMLQTTPADVVALLIQRGANIHAKTNTGLTPLDLALQNTFYVRRYLSDPENSVIGHLINAGSTIANVNELKKIVWRQLECSDITERKIDDLHTLFALLIKNEIALTPFMQSEPDKLHAYQRTLLHELIEHCDFNRNPELTKKVLTLLSLLKDNGVDINLKDVNGDTLLHKAISEIYDSAQLKIIVEELITLGVDPNKENQKKESPLYLAVRQGEPHIVDVLREKGANPLTAISDEALKEILLLNPIKEKVIAAIKAGIPYAQLSTHYSLYSATELGQFDAAELILNTRPSLSHGNMDDALKKCWDYLDYCIYHPKETNTQNLDHCFSTMRKLISLGGKLDSYSFEQLQQFKVKADSAPPALQEKITLLQLQALCGKYLRHLNKERGKIMSDKKIKETERAIKTGQIDEKIQLTHQLLEATTSKEAFTQKLKDPALLKTMAKHRDHPYFVTFLKAVCMLTLGFGLVISLIALGKATKGKKFAFWKTDFELTKDKMDAVLKPVNPKTRH